jgi:polysaccharide export outer membrane protein
LGEVNKPGRYELTYEDRISIYELLGLAGDLKKQADRNNVKIVRRNNDENQVFIIDLTKANALENPIFYLQPNDLVYVEPLKAVFWEQESFPFMSTVSIVLATITSLLVIFTYSKQ